MKRICTKCLKISDTKDLCPVCRSKTEMLKFPYLSKNAFFFIIYVSFLIAPLGTFMLCIKTPYHKKSRRLISSILFFLSGCFFYLIVSTILNDSFLFYIYQFSNLIIPILFIIYVIKPKSKLETIASIIYTLLVLLLILIVAPIGHNRQQENISHNNSILEDNTTMKNSLTVKTKNENNTDKKNNIAENLKMPPFEIVDSKLGSNLKSFAVYYEDQSKSNIILAAKCWKKQKGDNNIFIYFVNDKSYTIDNRYTESQKVTAFYESTVNGSVLHFLNSDGSDYETMNI